MDRRLGEHQKLGDHFARGVFLCRVAAPVAADFRAFAESCFEHAEILEALPSHIDLFRKQETLWDPAFQLYSGFLFQQ